MPFSAGGWDKTRLLREKVDAAWRDARIPPADQLVKTKPDAKPIGRYFAGRTAGQVDLDDPRIEQDFPLDYLTSEAISYYLQCYLRLCLDLKRQDARNEDSFFGWHPQIHHLCAIAPQLCRWQESILLTMDQMDCMCQTLQFLCEHADQYGLPNPYWAWDFTRPLKRALRCWRRQLAAQQSVVRRAQQGHGDEI